MRDKRDSLQTKRELFINLILHKLCDCDDDEYPLLYEGYMSDVADKYPLGRTCKKRSDVQYYIDTSIIIKKFDSRRRSIVTRKLDLEWREIDFCNPNFENTMINKIREFINGQQCTNST